MTAETHKPSLSDCLLGGPGHDGYAYNAAVYCVECGADIIRELYPTVDPVLMEDSEHFPQPIFFGESDCAEHCDQCSEYLYGSDPDQDDDYTDEEEEN